MINNYNEFKEYLKKLDTKPKLLLHACCGPCSTHTLKVLEDYFDITIYFDNSNMDTEEEFLKRLAAQKTVIESFKDIKLVVGKYLPETFYAAIKGDEHLGEFSSRCTKCMPSWHVRPPQSSYRYDDRVLRPMVHPPQCFHCSE